MDGKKISFGFMKTKKVEKPLIINSTEEKKEYIECVEEKSIKIVGGEEEKNDKPLIIPMKPNTLITPNRLKEIAEEVENAIATSEIKSEPNEPENIEAVAENETLDQMAVRELMEEAKKEIKIETNAITIPTPAKTVLEGEKESTLEDYEAIPIQEFGIALLRGMGWTPNKDSPKYKQPELRPKGLGLGAEKVIKQKKNQTSKDDKTEELTIMKNAYVKITNGKYANYYGKVVSLDEDNGRVMVDIPVKKETVSLSEFMMQAVTKSEYDRESKVINADSYEEYKQREKLKSFRKEENNSSEKRTEKEKTEENDRQRERNEKEKDCANGRSKFGRDSSSSDDKERRKKKKDRKRYSSCDSLNSLSEDDRKQSKNKSRHRRSRSKSNSRKRTPEGKRDIDKKRKGKKKKRDRDRSPNYKKHRK